MLNVINSQRQGQGQIMMTFSERRYMSSLVRLSSVVRNVRAPYSGDSNVRQCFYAILLRQPSEH